MIAVCTRFKERRTLDIFVDERHDDKNRSSFYVFFHLWKVLRRRPVVGISIGSLNEDAEPVTSRRRSCSQGLISSLSCCSCTSIFSTSSDASTCCEPVPSEDDVDDMLNDKADTDFFIGNISKEVATLNPQKPNVLMSAI